MLQFWLGEAGFGPYLKRFRESQASIMQAEEESFDGNTGEKSIARSAP